MTPFSGCSSLSVQTRPRVALVVEDDPSTRELLMRALVQLGCVAHGFGNSESALEWLESNRAPDIVSLDLGLPHACGLRVCEALRKNPRTRHVPVVVVTGRTDVQDEAAAIEAGADAFIEKPFRLREYQEAVRRLLDGQAIELVAAMS
jgi:DNA-binding response OmpR family regulator